MGFNAAEAVSELSYDFTSVGGPSGVTPEPTSDQVRTMQFRLRTLFKLDDGTSPEELAAHMAELTEGELRARDDELIEIYAAACSEKPSVAELRALPHRVLQQFIGWLSGELNTPTAGSAATKNSRAPLKSV